MANVYVSYSRSSQETARCVATALRSLGHDAIIDLELAPGDSFVEQFEARIREADAIIVIWSERSLRSPWVKREASLALSIGKYIGVVEGISTGLVPVPFNRDGAIVWRLGDDQQKLREDIAQALSVRGFIGQPALEGAPQQRLNGFAFISHVEEDVPVVSKIASFLKGRGYIYWTYHESDRDYQKPTVLEIEERLLDCALVLTVISPEWKRSEWTQRELAFAREARKPLFHLRFRNPGPTLAIAGDTYFDFERGEEDAFRKLGIELDKKGL